MCLCPAVCWQGAAHGSKRLDAPVPPLQWGGRAPCMQRTSAWRQVLRSSRTCKWKWACSAASSLSSLLQRPEEPRMMLSWLGSSCCCALCVLAGVAGSAGLYVRPAQDVSSECCTDSSMHPRAAPEEALPTNAPPGRLRHLTTWGSAGCHPPAFRGMPVIPADSLQPCCITE